MTKPTKWLRPAKTQISLVIPPIWSESSLSAQWVSKDPVLLHADSEDSDPTGRKPMLIWVFAGRSHFVGFVMRRLICHFNKCHYFSIFYICPHPCISWTPSFFTRSSIPNYFFWYDYEPCDLYLQNRFWYSWKYGNLQFVFISFLSVAFPCVLYLWVKRYRCHVVYNDVTRHSVTRSLMLHRGSYTRGHFIWNLWNEPSASFINFIWNDHECKILFKMEFYRLKSWHYFNRKHYVVTDGITTLRASNQVLCNVWSYDFYDMTLSTE